jgi:hypothetical protein
MNKKVLLLVFAVLLLYSMATNLYCADHKINGTWKSTINDNGDTIEYRFVDGRFESFNKSKPFQRGSYSISGDSITIIAESLFTLYPVDSENYIWFTKDEFLRDRLEDFLEPIAKMASTTIETELDWLFPVDTYNLVIDGDTLSLRYSTQSALGGRSYDEYVENYKSFKDMSITPEWTSRLFTRVK